MKVVVAAAAGNVGSRVLQPLIELGHEVVALRRESARAASMPLGCEVRGVDLSNASELMHATNDADALFWITPPNMEVNSLYEWYGQCTDAVVQAVRENRIGRVVHVSSLGAGSRPGLGTVSLVGEVEVRLNTVAANVVHLRPGYFMQNLLFGAAALADEGVLRLPYPFDHDMPWISAEDIAAIATRYLADSIWAGQWYQNLMGPENLTPVDLAKQLSLWMDRPVTYEMTSLADQRAALKRSGMNDCVADEMMSLFVALGDPDGVYATARTHDASTITTFQQFVQGEFIPSLSR